VPKCISPACCDIEFRLSEHVGIVLHTLRAVMYRRKDVGLRVQSREDVALCWLFHRDLFQLADISVILMR
jgi:hypothetical protein